MIDVEMNSPSIGLKLSSLFPRTYGDEILIRVNAVRPVSEVIRYVVEYNGTNSSYDTSELHPGNHISQNTRFQATPVRPTFSVSREGLGVRPLPAVGLSVAPV